jgi:hypothetical protein
MYVKIIIFKAIKYSNYFLLKELKAPEKAKLFRIKHLEAEIKQLNETIDNEISKRDKIDRAGDSELGKSRSRENHDRTSDIRTRESNSAIRGEVGSYELEPSRPS